MLENFNQQARWIHPSPAAWSQPAEHTKTLTAHADGFGETAVGIAQDQHGDQPDRGRRMFRPAFFSWPRDRPASRPYLSSPHVTNYSSRTLQVIVTQFTSLRTYFQRIFPDFVLD